MTDKTPPSRPALRKSVDAALHPALAGRTIRTESEHQAGSPAASPAVPGAADKAARDSARERAESAARSPSGKPLGKARRAPTSDVLRPTKHDPAVHVTVAMPKSMRKRLRTLAKQQGVEPEVLAAQLLAEHLRPA